MFESESKKIKAHALEAFPNESCGLIIEGVGYVRCENIHETPAYAFRIDPSQVVKYSGRIQAVVHSHPDVLNTAENKVLDYPTESDMRAQIRMAIPFGICSTNGSVAREPFYFGDTVEIPPLIGRGFRHGVTDCYSLIRDFYRKELEIFLPEFPREWEWWMSGKNMYVDLLQKAGFSRIEKNNNQHPKKGDIVFFTINSKVTNHAGIYLGDELVLHHLSGRTGVDMNKLSKREPITRWVGNIDFWARHKDLS